MTVDERGVIRKNIDKKNRNHLSPITVHLQFQPCTSNHIMASSSRTQSSSALVNEFTAKCMRLAQAMPQQHGQAVKTPWNETRSTLNHLEQERNEANLPPASRPTTSGTVQDQREQLHTDMNALDLAAEDVSDTIDKIYDLDPS